MVNLQALEAAIGKIERIRDHEFCFEVEDMKVCLRPLRPDEETEVQRYAQVALEQVSADEEADQASFADFMDRMRHASLAFAIVQIGDLDLREVEYLETGEKDDQGNLISVPKWEAVRDLTAREWSRAMLAQVFAKFGEMLERIELRAQKAINFEPVDLQEEIERTERRLSQLKETRDKIKQPVSPQASGRTPPRPEQRRASSEPVVSGEIMDEKEVVEPEAQPPPQAAQEEQGRASAIPASASAPERSPPPEPSQEPPEAENQATGQSEEEAEFDQDGIPLPHGGDSFFDPTDPDEAMAAESRRQAILHQRRLAKQRAEKVQQRMREEIGMPTEEEMAAERLREDRAAKSPKGVRLDGQTEGLRAAANLNDAVFDSGAGSVRTGRPGQPQPQPGGQGKPAQLHGKPVYKMPTQTLDRPERERKHGEPPESPVRVNNPSVGGRQTKFRGPNQ